MSAEWVVGTQVRVTGAYPPFHRTGETCPDREGGSSRLGRLPCLTRPPTGRSLSSTLPGTHRLRFPGGQDLCTCRAPDDHVSGLLEVPLFPVSYEGRVLAEPRVWREDTCLSCPVLSATLHTSPPLVPGMGRSVVLGSTWEVQRSSSAEAKDLSTGVGAQEAGGLETKPSSSIKDGTNLR